MADLFGCNIMDASTLAENLTWSQSALTIREFLDEFGIPNVVRLRNSQDDYGHSSSSKEVLLLNKRFTKQYFTGKDSNGKSILIPQDCQKMLLLRPLPEQCQYEELLVEQLPYVFPQVKYLRVLNTGAGGSVSPCFKPESIVEIEFVDAGKSLVKFKDIDKPLLFGSCLAFQPLLDFREYLIEDAVRKFGLPLAVRKTFNSLSAVGVGE